MRSMNASIPIYREVMAGRRTNLALLMVLASALLTGTVAFASGTAAGRWVVIAHGVVGLGLIVLLPWKSVIVRRGLRRRRTRRRTERWTSVGFGVLVLTAVVTGVLHSGWSRLLPGGLTTMQVHVGAALAAIPLGVWHVVARPVRPRRTDLSRRTALRTAGGAALAGAVWLSAEALWRTTSAPGADRRFTGSHEVGSDDPAAMPVTQWFTDRVPRIEAIRWRLHLTDGHGARTLALDDLGRTDQVRATLDCTGGWFAHQEWSGVRLDRLVDPAGGDSLLIRSATGYTRRLPIEDLATLLLATRVGGAPLSAGHGFPARLVVPGRRGFWWVKWVTDIRVDSVPPWAQPPFPLT